MVLGEWVTPDEGKGAKSDRLFQLFLLTGFDLSKLTPKTILEITEQREAFAALKHELDRIAADLSDGYGEEQRENDLKKAAGLVIERWGDSRNLSRGFARSFFTGGLVDHGEGFLKDVVKDAVTAAIPTATAGTASALAASTATAALTSAVVLAAGAGLAVGVISYTVRAAWRASQQIAKSPYRYLTTVSRAASRPTARSVGRSTLATYPANPVALGTGRCSGFLKVSHQRVWLVSDPAQVKVNPGAFHRPSDLVHPSSGHLHSVSEGKPVRPA